MALIRRRKQPANEKFDEISDSIYKTTWTSTRIKYTWNPAEKPYAGDLTRCVEFGNWHYSSVARDMSEPGFCNFAVLRVSEILVDEVADENKLNIGKEECISEVNLEYYTK